MRVILLLLPVLLIAAAGCKSDGSASDAATARDLRASDASASEDLAATDLAARDLAGSADGTVTTDGGAPGCVTAGECRLFSSYCDNAPCQCLALLKTAKDPVCMGSKVTCLLDPCKNRQAGCNPAHECEVQ